MKPNVSALFSRRALLGLLALGLIWGLPHALAAKRRRGPDPNKPPEIANPFRGVVSNVSPTSITVEGEGRLADSKNASADGKVKIHFSIKPDTPITRDGKAITAADIQKNEPVRVTYTAKPGSTLRQVTKIEVGNFDKPQDDAPGGQKKKKKK
ncbi:MAG: hypothetical protein N2689_17220 [Verrucomicrobiae bacterium]|nr:hypothetical protein [Verrucomicrobiae bacterium]